MPDTACLHIQARESDPVRVVDLRSGPVRIGRAVFCDVRLNDPDLADEACRLRRRGGAWQIIPVGDRLSVRLDGRPVDAPTSLAIGMTFLVGSHSLTLQPAATLTSWPDRPLPASTPARPPDTSMGDDATGGWVHARRETKRWESRWRAAGEKLRSASVLATPTSTAIPPRPESPTVDPRVSRAEPPVIVKRPEAPAAPVAVHDAPLTRPAGYVPPAAPSSLREPVRSSAWSHSEVSRRPVPRDPVRVRRTAERPLTLTPQPSPTRGEESQKAADRDVWSPLPLRERDRVSERGHSTRTETTPVAAPPPESPAPIEAGTPASEEPQGSQEAPVHTVEAVPQIQEETQGQHSVEVPHGEHVDLSNAEFDALLSRLQSLIPGDVTPTSVVEADVPTVEGIAEAEVDALPLRAEPSPAVSPDPIDDEEDRDDEPETARPVLGAARRGVRVSRLEPLPRPAILQEDRPWESSKPTSDEPRAIPDLEAVSRGSSEWPSVREILAAQGARPLRDAARAPIPRGRRPEPTEAREPGQWRLPLWLAWLPATAAAVVVGAAGLAGAWVWSVDGYKAGLVTQRLAAVVPSKSPMPEGVSPTPGSWWATSATHLVQWAAYLDRVGGDPVDAQEARGLLDRAAAVAPLNPTVRYAMARPLPGEPVAPALAMARGLGQTRDVPTLTWAGRSLLAAGKKESALRAFRAAMEMAARSDLARAGVPAFLDDPQVRRFALPTEDALAPIVRAMAGSTAWSYQDWAGALPRGTAAAVVAARVLRESGSPDAAAALDAALADGSSPSPTPSKSKTAEAVRLAALAEALTIAQRWADARDRYRQAIDLMPVETVRRAWSFNLADLASRLDEDAERQTALEAAKVADMKDEITRRVVDLQRASGAFARRAGGRVADSAVIEAGARR